MDQITVEVMLNGDKFSMKVLPHLMFRVLTALRERGYDVRFRVPDEEMDDGWTCWQPVEA